MTWKVCGASIAGPSHIERSIPCQDNHAYRCEGEAIAIAACDGAGSATRSDEGSRILADTFVDAMIELFQRTGPLDLATVREHACKAIVAARAKVSKLDVSIEHFHSTLVAFAANSNHAYLFHIGDGYGVAFDFADLSEIAASHPENGEYANHTFFFTLDQWESFLRVQDIGTPPPAIALMSDGVTGCALKDDAINPAFFRPIANYLLATPADKASQDLAYELDSENARRASEDDKTLVMAFQVERCQ